MPIAPCRQITRPRDKIKLAELGRARVTEFCKANDLPVPEVTIVPSSDWYVGSCAYYRNAEGIKICVTECAWPTTEGQTRNWNWPASVIDREPYGVVCHELGHHVDYLQGENKGRYGSDYSEKVRKLTKEREVTSYCPNSWEWFAEIFRVFVTNPGLLRDIRPKTYAVLAADFKPVGSMDWIECIGSDVPPRLIKTLMNKGAK